MADVMMMFGGFQFGLDTAAFQELNRNTEWRWPAQDVFESRPVLQFTGYGEDTITLPGIIFPEYWGGTGQIETLRALGDLGEPQTLIDGRGNVLGEWVITSVQERQSVFAQAGVGRRQEFTVTLKRYGDSVATASPAGAVTAAVTAPASAAATEAAKAAAPSSLAGLKSVVDSAAAAASKAAASLAEVQAKVAGGVQTVTNGVGAALNAARTLQLAGRDAQAALKGMQSITSYTTAVSAVNGLLGAANGAANAATRASGLMRTAVGSTDAAVVEVNKLAVSAANISSRINATVKGFGS